MAYKHKPIYETGAYIVDTLNEHHGVIEKWELHKNPLNGKDINMIFYTLTDKDTGERTKFTQWVREECVLLVEDYYKKHIEDLRKELYNAKKKLAFYTDFLSKSSPLDK